MERPKVLFVSQEIEGYLPKTHISHISRFLPQRVQDLGKEVRAFMPRYGLVNERRNQLHEVIRLSGINLIIDESDHPLIIKVASIQPSRMQVYFIDNEDYFLRKTLFVDEKGVEYTDNDERCVFARGVLETVKKLRWSPAVVHCHGWFTSLVPLYLKKTFYEDPIFNNSKVVISLYSESFVNPFGKTFRDKIYYEGVTDLDLASLDHATFLEVNKLAIDHCDGVIAGDENVPPELLEYARKLGKPVIEYTGMDHMYERYNEFYDQLLNA